MKVIRTINVDADLWEQFRASVGASKELGCKSRLSQTVETLIRQYLEKQSKEGDSKN